MIMLVNSNNYFEYVAKIGIGNLTPSMKKSHDLIAQKTENGKNWNALQSFKSFIDKQFEAIELLLKSLQKEKGSEKPSVAKITSHPHSKKLIEKKQNAPKQAVVPTSKPEKQLLKQKGKEVELISPEVSLIKRFALLQNKEKNRQQILNFVKAIQKAIIERRIRKTSKYANVISFIQKQLVNTYNTMGESIGFRFTTQDYNKYLKIAGAEYLLPSVQFIKAYINMIGQSITQEKAARLLERIEHALGNERVAPTDKYLKEIKLIIAALQRFLKSKDSPALTEAQLNGLEGIIKSCSCHLHKTKPYKENYGSSLSGVEEESETLPRNKILNSKQVVNLKSEKLNFSGKWLNFIGNPSKGFTAMIYGKPKFGKSYLAIDFAGYLARNHGKVLYVAREEGFDDTLQQKLKDKNVADDNLFVSDFLPRNLSDYNFVFLDSVNKLDLSAEELEKIESKYPDISFVYVFQTTKGGDFKGNMEFKHNVDAVIEVPQRGLATQYGRYNQGAEMRIF